MQRDMEYILMVYKTGSFSKAAERLFASQPTVSMAVQRVEEELGTRLFERGTSPLRPTEAGKRYLAHADRIAQSEAQLRRELDGISGRFQEEFRLGCLPMHTQSLMPGFLERLSADHPDAHISVISAFPGELYRMLREGDVDLVISNMAGSNDADITYMPAVKDQLLVAVPEDFPINERLKDFALRASQISVGRHIDPSWPCVPLSVFAGTPFILFTKSSDFYSFIHSVCTESDFTPEIRFSVSAPILAYALTRHGLGATLIGSLLVNEGDDMLRYYKLRTRKDEQTFYFAVRSEGELTDSQRCMIQSFRAFFDS